MINVSVSLSAGTLKLDVDQLGGGRPLLLLHGGAGPRSMRPIVGLLEDFKVLLPTHPGFDGTERPSWITSMKDLANCYLALIGELGLQDVVVVGNSVGGWIAAEMVASQPLSFAGIILVNAVGLEPTDVSGPIANPRSLPPGELVKLSFSDSAKAPPFTPEVATQLQANQQVLMAYAGQPYMHDPELADRLSRITTPALVLWGSSDRVVTPEYGREYARRIPGARFEVIREAGHLPQIEQPEATAQAIRTFCNSTLRSGQN